MNFLGHVSVALAVDRQADELVALGSILPDLESLMGGRLVDHRDHPSIVRGIALHRATDAVFHDDERFRSGWIALSRDLQARAVGRGASRAVGHAGWELLLDGLLVGDGAVTDAFDAACAALVRLAPGDGRLVELARRQSTTPIWHAYADPAQIADRLQRQLRHRALLSFDEAALPAVTAGLRTAAAGVATVGPGLIADVAERVTLPA